MRPVGMLQMNEYFIACKKTGEAGSVDSGSHLQIIFRHSLRELVFDKALDKTHAHIDHVTGL